MDYELLKKNWQEKDQQGKKLKEKMLTSIIEEFIGKQKVTGLT